MSYIESEANVEQNLNQLEIYLAWRQTLKNALTNLSKIDIGLTRQARKMGHRAERYLIGGLFIWFGLLKLTGQTSATSIIAKSVYWFEPATIIPILGGWEVLMGICLLFRTTIRLAIALFFIRVPGTILALIYHWDECFADSILIPTIQGQYLIKELTLVGAALVIASSLPPLLHSNKAQTI